MFDLHLGDCIEVMRGLPEASVDAIVTDPPYGIRFMGKAWDGADIERKVAERRAAPSHAPNAGPNGGHKSIAAEAGQYDTSLSGNRAFQEWTREWATEALRVLKPGGFLLSFASTRTYHRMASGVEDAGFEIRDQIGWVFGSGFPKSHNGPWGGTALKPAWEPIVVARKPLIGTVEANWREHGTGALNIDGCRVQTADDLNGGRYSDNKQGDDGNSYGSGINLRSANDYQQPAGRWPANLIHDGSDEVVALFPAEAGAQSPVKGTERSAASVGQITGERARVPGEFHGDTGSAARFFYCAKASKRDRDEGLDAMPTVTADPYAQHRGRRMSDNNTRIDGKPPAQGKNNHPTVKPTDLMRYLCRLVTPAGGVVLDPFTGSGSTGKAALLEGLRFVGIEREHEYMAIARARIEHAHHERLEATRQGSLFAGSGAETEPMEGGQ